MTFEKGNTGFFICFLLIGAILGSVIGTFLAGIAPALSVLNKSLSSQIGFNLEVLSFHVNITPFGIVGLLSGIIIFKKV